jgi:hypothetical protein
MVRIQAAVLRKRHPLRSTAEIALAVGAVIDTYKMGEYFDLTICDAAFSFVRKIAEIQAEGATDGLFAVRASLPAEALPPAGSADRPSCITGWPTGFVRTCSSGCWWAGLRRPPCRCRRMASAPIAGACATRRRGKCAQLQILGPRGTGLPVRQALRSPAAVTEQTTGLTEDGLPVHSFRSLLSDLATLARIPSSPPSHRSIRSLGQLPSSRRL